MSQNNLENETPNWDKKYPQYSQPRRQVQTHYNNLIKLNYTEEPIDVVSFISSPQFLGVSTRNGEDVYPRWKQVLSELFDDNGKIIAVLTGSIGTGKSTIALYALCYIQYRLMILKDPWGFFSLADSGKMTISFFNINKTLGDSRGYRKMQSLLAKSPWFRSRATHISQTKDGENLEFALIKYVLASPYSKGFGVLGEDVVSGILDEVDSPSEGLAQKKRVLETYSATVIRFKNRFAQTGYSLGKLLIVSSKQDEMSFIDTFIAERKNSPEVAIFDIPLWEAKPQHTFSGETFPIAIGDAYTPPKMIEENEVAKYLTDGYKIIRPPVEFKVEFQLDLIRSLRDIAGITTAGTRKSKLFPSERFILECFDKDKVDPVRTPIIQLGLEGDEQLIWHLDISKFRMPKHTPRFIHYDISFSGDNSGLAMSGVKGWTTREVENPDGTFRKEIVPIIETDFAMCIKARPGDRIPIHKIRKLILDLRAAGIHIFRFTADLKLASEDTLQLLKSAGINAEYISMDKKNEPYFDFREMVFDRRWICHKHSLLFSELTNLEQSASDGKVDHPVKITVMRFLDDGSIKEEVELGSKDVADAVAGSVVQCSRHSGQPMDTELIATLLNKTRTVDGTTRENLGPLLKLPDGQEVIGPNTQDGVKSINDIFQRLRQR